jgi:hypothetical protein
MSANRYPEPDVAVSTTEPPAFAERIDSAGTFALELDQNDCAATQTALTGGA